MKYILSVLSLLFITACGTKQNSSGSKEDVVEKITITAQDVKTSMEYLASDELKGRATGSEGIEKAAVFIESFFKTFWCSDYPIFKRATLTISNMI